MTALAKFSPANAVAVPSAMVMLPKLDMTGKFIMTAIDPNAITGIQPTTLDYKGKKYDGSKVYTKTGSFKIFADPSELLIAQHSAKAGVLSYVNVPTTLNSAAAQYIAVTSKVKQLTA